MLTALFLFEIKYHLKQVTFRASALLFFLLGLLMTFGSFENGDVYPNAPYVINFIVCLLTLFSVFVITLVCAAVVLRDAQHNMEPLIFATSIGRRPYFLARFGGLLGAVTLVMCLALTGVALGSVFPRTVPSGPFHLTHYLAPLCTFALPGIIFCGSIVFATALLTHNVRYVYAAGIFLFIIYLTASILGNSPVMASSKIDPAGPGWLSILLDPFGFTAFFGETMKWPVWQRNSAVFPLTPVFLANRFLWTGISLALLAITYSRFKFRVLPGIGNKTNAISKEPTAPNLHYRAISAEHYGPGYQLRTFSGIFRLETKAIFGHILTLIMLALWVFFNTIELSENLTNGPYSVRSYATTGVLAEQLLAVRPALLLLIFYASEIIHRERNTGMQALVFSTPVSKIVFANAKLAALICWIAVLMTVHIGIGVAVQCFEGVFTFEWGIYFSLYYYAGLPLVLFAVLIVFIQTIFPNKYLGMLVSGLLTGIFLFGRKLGIDSYLARFALTPSMQYSDISGFGEGGLAFHGYMLYWSGFALVLGALNGYLWIDGTRDSWQARWRDSLRQWNRYAWAITSIGLLLFVATGFYIHSQTGQSAHNRHGGTDLEWQAHYERKYKSFENLPQPVVTAVNLHTDLFPEQHYYAVKGSFRVKNKSSLPISRLWFGVDPDVELLELRPEGAAPDSSDAPFCQHFFHRKQPLMPGEEMIVHFSLRVDRPPFKTFNSENALTANGSYIELEKYLPHMGYRPSYEIEDAQQRRENNLPRLVSVPSPDDAYHFIDFQNIISTPADQQVVTVGSLEKAWTSDGRKYFQYKAPRPIPFMFALSSARYALKTEKHYGTTFRIYYHPGHTQNLAAMVQAMKDAIDYGNTHFSPYQYRELTLAEIPDYPGSATAYPGVIFSRERTNFRSNFSDSTHFNFTYATTAHEAAHQWWAGRLAAPYGPGDALLTESLAKYTEAMVTEKRFGKMYLRPYHIADKHLYFAQRNATGEKESTLWKTSGQTFVHYQKGGLALYRLKEILGEKHINSALQRLIAQHGYPLRKPRPADLVEALKQGTDPAGTRLIDDLFTKVITYDNTIKILSDSTLPNQRHLLTLQIDIKKTDETSGKPVSVRADDAIAIAVFDQELKPGSINPTPIYLKTHYFTKNQSTVRIVAPGPPVTVLLDPMSCVLDAHDF